MPISAEVTVLGERCCTPVAARSGAVDARGCRREHPALFVDLVEGAA
jgi:hypothetical protein